MNNKAFFQFVSILGLISTFVFLFTDEKEMGRIMISGAIFLIAGILALVAGKTDAGK